MKSLAVALGLLLLSTPAFAMGAKKPVVKTPEVVVPVPVDVEPVGNVNPSEARPFLTVKKCDNCTVAEFDFIQKGVAKTNETVISACFRQKLTAMDLIQTDGKSPAEVVDSLIHAGIVIDAEMYWTAKRVLGYTLPNVMKEWINRRYMMKWNVCDLGSLLAHETSHKVGYKHDFERTKRRPQSVPYSINRAFKACCTK